MHASKLVRGSQVCLIAGLGGKTAFCGVVKKASGGGPLWPWPSGQVIPSVGLKCVVCAAALFISGTTTASARHEPILSSLSTWLRGSEHMRTTTPGAPPKHLSNKPSDPITASLTCKPLEHSRAQALLLSLADQRSRGSLVSSVLLSANTTRSWVGKLNKRACNEKQGRLGGKGHEDQWQSTAGRHYARNYHNEMLVGRAMVYKWLVSVSKKNINLCKRTWKVCTYSVFADLYDLFALRENYCKLICVTGLFCLREKYCTRSRTKRCRTKPYMWSKTFCSCQLINMVRGLLALYL
jgi:hypothetical protein